MRVDFPKEKEEDLPKPKYKFRLRFVAEIVLNEFDLWTDYSDLSEIDPPANITLKKAVAHLKDRHDSAQDIMNVMLDAYAEDFETTLDVSFEEGSKVVELVERPDDD